MLEQQKTTGRGIPRNGFRMTIGRKLAIEQAKQNGIDLDLSHFTNTKPDFIENLIKQKEQNLITHPPKPEQTDDDILQSISERFGLLEELTLSTALGISPSLIVSGSAGIGKTTEIMNAINSLDMGDACKVVKGSITPLALYKLLYEVRQSGSLLVLDDSDDCWDDEKSMNLIKAATDSSDERIISWYSSRKIFDNDDLELPSDFIFEGSIIFISNLDFYSIAESNNKLAPHFNAMISRSFVLDLSMKNSREYLLRIKSILFNDSFGGDMTLDIKNDIYRFMSKERDNLRDISLRMVKKLHIIIQTYGSKWENNARILFCKRS